MPKATDDTDLESFEGFLQTFGHGDGELLRDLTHCLAKAVRATNSHGGKSTFTIKFDIEQADDTLWGQLAIEPTITEKPARARRVGHYRTDPESGQISLL